MQSELNLTNEIIALTLAPDFGARVTGLVDLRSGRDWLVKGPLVGVSDDDAVFDGVEARGWDECFPTVAPCDDMTWGRSLRDHGEIWGRKTVCEASPEAVSFAYHGDRYKFLRTLTLNGDRLNIDYQVHNTGTDPFPYMWSQHCLLATTPKDRLFVNGTGSFNVTGVIGSDRPKQFAWPEFSQDRPDLQMIESIDAGWALKAYAPARDHIQVGVNGPIGGISFEWSRDQIPYVGMWLDYGAWPGNAPVHQIAIEPTTAPADHLASAITKDAARWLNGGDSHSWCISIRLTENASTEITNE